MALNTVTHCKLNIERRRKIYGSKRKEMCLLEINSQLFTNMWKLKKEMFPQARDMPTAMLDKNGILQTDGEKLKSIALEA